FFEHEIELRERLTPDRERNFADAKIGIFQKFACLLEPGLSDVIDKLDAGHLLKLFAQMGWINSSCACNAAQRKRFARMFLDKLPGAPNVSGFGAMAVWREGFEPSEASFGCVF